MTGVLLVGLVGSNQEKREAVAAVVADELKSRMVRFDPWMDNRQDRVQLYRMTVDLMDLQAGGKTMMLVNVDSEVESAWLREQGGFVWHVEGNPSSVVPMTRGVDIPVGLRATSTHLSPLQALSESWHRLERRSANDTRGTGTAEAAANG